MLSAAKLAEERGFGIIHGIIDALYITKADMTEQEIAQLRREIEMQTGIPLSFEGIFKWIVFLPSVNNDDRPLPSRYYGVFTDGTIKARGIEVRQRNVPKIVVKFQETILKSMALCDNQDQILALVPNLLKILRYFKDRIHESPPDDLVMKVRLSSVDYKTNIPQKHIVEQLQKSGIKVMPGQVVRYIRVADGAILPERYSGKPDIAHYLGLLIRSLFIVLQPFGITKDEIAQAMHHERQTRLTEYLVRLQSC